MRALPHRQTGRMQNTLTVLTSAIVCVTAWFAAQILQTDTPNELQVVDAGSADSVTSAAADRWSSEAEGAVALGVSTGDALDTSVGDLPAADADRMQAISDVATPVAEAAETIWETPAAGLEDFSESAVRLPPVLAGEQPHPRTGSGIVSAIQFFDTRRQFGVVSAEPESGGAAVAAVGRERVATAVLAREEIQSEAVVDRVVEHRVSVGFAIPEREVLPRREQAGLVGMADLRAESETAVVAVADPAARDAAEGAELFIEPQVASAVTPARAAVQEISAAADLFTERPVVAAVAQNRKEIEAAVAASAAIAGQAEDKVDPLFAAEPAGSPNAEVSAMQAREQRKDVLVAATDVVAKPPVMVEVQGELPAHLQQPLTRRIARVVPDVSGLYLADPGAGEFDTVANSAVSGPAVPEVPFAEESKDLSVELAVAAGPVAAGEIPQVELPQISMDTAAEIDLRAAAEVRPEEAVEGQASDRTLAASEDELPFGHAMPLQSEALELDTASAEPSVVEMGVVEVAGAVDRKVADLRAGAARLKDLNVPMSSQEFQFPVTRAPMKPPVPRLDRGESKSAPAGSAVASDVAARAASGASASEADETAVLPGAAPRKAGDAESLVRSAKAGETESARQQSLKESEHSDRDDDGEQNWAGLPALQPGALLVGVGEMVADFVDEIPRPDLRLPQLERSDWAALRPRMPGWLRGAKERDVSEVAATADPFLTARVGNSVAAKVNTTGPVDVHVEGTVPVLEAADKPVRDRTTVAEAAVAAVTDRGSEGESVPGLDGEAGGRSAVVPRIAAPWQPGPVSAQRRSGPAAVDSGVASAKLPEVAAKAVVIAAATTAAPAQDFPDLPSLPPVPPVPLVPPALPVSDWEMEVLLAESTTARPSRILAVAEQRTAAVETSRGSQWRARRWSAVDVAEVQQGAVQQGAVQQGVGSMLPTVDMLPVAGDFASVGELTDKRSMRPVDGLRPVPGPVPPVPVLAGDQQRRMDQGSSHPVPNPVPNRVQHEAASSRPAAAVAVPRAVPSVAAAPSEVQSRVWLPGQLQLDSQPQIQSQSPRRGRGLLYSLKTELRDVSAPLWMQDLSATLHQPQQQFSTGMHRISSTLWYAGRPSLE